MRHLNTKRSTSARNFTLLQRPAVAGSKVAEPAGPEPQRADKKSPLPPARSSQPKLGAVSPLDRQEKSSTAEVYLIPSAPSDRSHRRGGSKGYYPSARMNFIKLSLIIIVLIGVLSATFATAGSGKIEQVFSSALSNVLSLSSEPGSKNNQPAATATSSTSPSSSSNNNTIRIGLPFETHIDNPSIEKGIVDYVFGSNWPGNPQGVYKTFYLPYDRDEDPRWYAGAHDLPWWKANHPDWIEYKCDRTTIAYEFSQSTNIPLDITNPAELSYIEQTYLVPALQAGSGYAGIAFDNLAFQNAGSWTGQRCGHFDKSGNWVAQFTGTSNDPAYRQAILNWAQTIHAWIHTNFPNAGMSANFSFDPAFPSDSDKLLSKIDIDIDEQGFTNGNSAPPWYISGQPWLAKVQALQSYLASGRGWFSINQEPVQFNSLTTGQVQWVLANYLLLKNNFSYVYICGHQQYGYLLLRPEYSAKIGTAVGLMHSSQGVYMRDFTNGLAIVNPSSTQTFTIKFPPNSYKDLYGNNINSFSMGPHTGIVLISVGGSK